MSPMSGPDLSFEARNLAPMIFKESEKVFDSPDYFYELKFDGIRSLAYLDGKTDLVNKRGKLLNAIYPELADLHACSKEKALLDGELVLMREGKPDFFELQKRSLLSDSLKIEIQSKIHPVVYVAFDLLYWKDRFLIDEPLWKRKELLQENIKEGKSLAIPRHIEGRGRELFAAAERMDLEGIVAKRKDSLYYPGKRTSVWLKMKVYEEEDLLILGYVPKENLIDLILGRFVKGRLEKAGSVPTGRIKEEILAFAAKHPSAPLFPEPKEAVWMEPKLVGKVRYMMKTEKGGLRQPVFIGLRDDKFAEDLFA